MEFELPGSVMDEDFARTEFLCSFAGNVIGFGSGAASCQMLPTESHDPGLAVGQNLEVIGAHALSFLKMTTGKRVLRSEVWSLDESGLASTIPYQFHGIQMFQGKSRVSPVLALRSRILNISSNIHVGHELSGFPSYSDPITVGSSLDEEGKR